MMKNKKVISDPHDRFFKEMLSDKSKSIELLQCYGQADVINSIDVSSLKLMSTTFIDKNLKKNESDILYQVKINNQVAYFYFLLEHQSTPDAYSHGRLPLQRASGSRASASTGSTPQPHRRSATVGGRDIDRS